jgi:hypothetical protein
MPVLHQAGHPVRVVNPLVAGSLSQFAGTGVMIGFARPHSRRFKAGHVDRAECCSGRGGPAKAVGSARVVPIVRTVRNPVAPVGRAR